MEVLRCASCGLPNSRVGIKFDGSGVCSVCRHHEFKNQGVDWDRQRIELEEYADSIRNRGPYDAIVPFGGGKDGAFTLFYLVKHLKLRCLAVTIDNHFLRDQAKKNCAKVLDELGVDQIVYRPPFSLVTKLMKKGLELGGTVCWHCNSAIAAFPVRMAVDREIPLVFYAHSLKEYYSYPGRTYRDDFGSDVMDQEWYELVSGVNFDKMKDALPDLDARALKPFSFPTKEEIHRSDVRAVFLSNYIIWDEKSQSKIIQREMGWQGDNQEGVPNSRNYEKFDCFLVGTHDYLRFIREGYGRGARLGAIETRMNRMTQEEAINLGRSSDGIRPHSLDNVLKILDCSEQEFVNFAKNHASSNSKFKLQKNNIGPPLHDADRMASVDRTDNKESPD